MMITIGEVRDEEHSMSSLCPKWDHAKQNSLYINNRKRVSAFPVGFVVLRVHMGVFRVVGYVSLRWRSHSHPSPKYFQQRLPLHLATGVSGHPPSASDLPHRSSHDTTGFELTRLPKLFQ